MALLKWSAVVVSMGLIHAPAVMAAAFVSDQGGAKGFIEDASLNLLLRTLYWNRDNQNGAPDARDWTLGIQGVFTSGFTQGTVGVGVDAFGYQGLKLWAPDQYSVPGYVSGNLTEGADGHADDDYGKAGAALKVRVSRTLLKIGDMQPSTSPVFAVGGSRLTPVTVSGVQVMSSEVSDLDLEAGHFYSGTSQDQTNRNGSLWAAYANRPSRAMDFAGGRYALADTPWSFGLYSGRLEDIWDQYYANLNYTQALSDSESLVVDANYYRTRDQGAARAGTIDNNTFSLSAGYTFASAHTLTVAFQKINGNTPFDYVGTGDNNRPGDSCFIANSVQYSDFNGPGEKSWKLQYDLNLAAFGVPGLTFMTRYVYGYDIDGTHLSPSSAYYGLYGADERHHETNVEAKYVIQSGPARDLSIRLRQAWHSATAGDPDGDANEFRLTVDYPIAVF
ncbi:OprD family porin [Pseudomonas eucalypticola]|uniref:OprD family porin n=1 Tax=Pseudomonas eucalypticola TaxID=2599595 RepID=A0A7D5H0K3_9PSED|nr:OprD family porin [Pseudomonas eucalypticola]QKZ04765.1 OprD family porin [Pseudomonas eucalypticola]